MYCRVSVYLHVLSLFPVSLCVCVLSLSCSKFLMSHSPCLIDVRSAAATLPARRWADMVDEECALPATIPRTPPDELSALSGSKF